MEDLKNIKEAAVRMALHCGKIQMESFRTQNIGIDTKSNVYDVVTKVDKACEDYLLTEIARLYPTHSVLGEETGQHLHADSDWAWVVDKRQLRCSSFKELIAEKPDFFLSEKELFNLFLA